MARGSCLCGGVEFEVSGPLEEIHHCHCSKCRKSHGAAFSTYAGTREESFRITAGEGKVRRYRSSPDVERSFCGVCGSNLTFRWDAVKGALWVATGCFDDDPGLRPQLHIFVGSKAPWHEITDALPQHREYPEPS